MVYVRGVVVCLFILGIMPYLYGALWNKCFETHKKTYQLCYSGNSNKSAVSFNGRYFIGDLFDN